MKLVQFRKTTQVLLIIYTIFISSCSHEEDRAFDPMEFVTINCHYMRSFGLSCDDESLESSMVLILNDKSNAKSYLLNFNNYVNGQVYYRLFHSEYPKMYEIPLASSGGQEHTGLTGNYISGVSSKQSLDRIDGLIDNILKNPERTGTLMLITRNGTVEGQIENTEWVYLSEEELSLILEYLYSLLESHDCFQCINE